MYVSNRTQLLVRNGPPALTTAVANNDAEKKNTNLRRRSGDVECEDDGAVRGRPARHLVLESLGEQSANRGAAAGCPLLATQLKTPTKKHKAQSTKRDEARWDGTGWSKTGRDATRWDGTGQYGTGWNATETERNEKGWHGTQQGRIGRVKPRPAHRDNGSNSNYSTSASTYCTSTQPCILDMPAT